MRNLRDLEYLCGGVLTTSIGLVGGSLHPNTVTAMITLITSALILLLCLAYESGRAAR